jgi:hypothetical protein
VDWPYERLIRRPTVVELGQCAERLLAGLDAQSRGDLEVSVMRLVDHQVDTDERGRTVSTGWCLDELVTVRWSLGDAERFVTMPASSDAAVIAEALDRSPRHRRPSPMCDGDPGGGPATGSAGSPQPLRSIMRELEQLEDRTRREIERLTHDVGRRGPRHPHSMLVRDRTNEIRNSRGGSARFHERYLRLRQTLAADGLTWQHALCYPTAYAGETVPLNPTVGRDHSGRFDVSGDPATGSGSIVIQGDVMVELLAVWARGATESRSDGTFSRAVSISERPIPFRTPAVDDSGCTIGIRRYVTRGAVSPHCLEPQGAYRQVPEAPLVPSYSALVLEPSTAPLGNLLAPVDRGFYASQITSLVIGEDTGGRRSLQLRLGGFEIESGALVGELRWIEGMATYDQLFATVSAVGSCLHWGRWKWTDGWYASPAVVFDRLLSGSGA